MLEFIHQDARQRFSKRLPLIFSPEREVFAHAVNFNRLEHQMNGGRAEQLTDKDHQGQLDPTTGIQFIETKIEKLLPKCQMSGFDGNEFIQCVMRVGVRDSSESLVQGKIEELIENECLGERAVVQNGRFHQIRLAGRKDSGGL